MENNKLDEEIKKILSVVATNKIETKKHIIKECLSRYYLISPKMQLIEDQIFNYKGKKEIDISEIYKIKEINFLKTEFKYITVSMYQKKEKKKEQKKEQIKGLKFQLANKL